MTADGPGGTADGGDDGSTDGSGSADGEDSGSHSGYVPPSADPPKADAEGDDATDAGPETGTNADADAEDSYASDSRTHSGYVTPNATGPKGDAEADAGVGSEGDADSGANPAAAAGPIGDTGTGGGSESDDESADDSGTAADGGAYDVDEVDPYGGPGETPTGPTPGAPDDQEMPLADHIEEMIRRLAVVVVAGGLVAAVVFPFADRLINFLWYSFLPGSVEVCPVPVASDPSATAASSEAACPYVYHPLALMFARLKVASLVGFIAAMPVMVYESYLFMRPGLYPRERRYYLASVPTSLILAGVGVAFAYLLVLPTLFLYFTGYTDQAAEIAFGLSETFNLIVMMLGFFALVFQIPLLIMLAVLMGVTSRKWLADRRLYFYGGFATVAFLFSPDPTGMAPILVAVTMIVLFEGSLLILRWTLESSPVPSAEGLATRRPAVYLLALTAGYLTSTAPLPGGYYGSLPAAVRDGLASFGLTRATPLLVGIGFVAVYELLAYLARRTGADPRARRALSRGRALTWPLFLVVGYFGSPNPVLIARVEALEFGLPRVAAVVVGLVGLFELSVRVLDWRESREE